MENYQEESQRGDPLLKAGRGLEAKSEVGAEELGHLSRVGESPRPPRPLRQHGRILAAPGSAGCRPSPRGPAGRLDAETPPLPPTAVTASFLSRDPGGKPSGLLRAPRWAVG